MILAEQAGTTLRARVSTAADSPWYDGHFPGDPILPGIAQLKMVADLIARFGTGVRPTGLSRVRFKRLVRPGEQLDIIAKPAGRHQYTFRIIGGGTDICSGIMLFAATE